jgi:hypothetical protein
MLEEIAVCIVTNENDIETQYVLENLKEKTKCNLNIYTAPFEKSLCDCINNLLIQVKEDLCVLFPANALVNENWCEDLLFNMKNVNKPGVIGIRHGKEKLKLSPVILVDDELINVWFAENNIIEGIMMFETKHIKEEIGMFDKLFDHTGFQYAEFSLKFAFSGLTNFYIRKQTFIPIEIENESLYPKKTKDGVFLINEFVKANIDFHGN